MFVLEPRGDENFVIVHENCIFGIGYVRKDGDRYRVERVYAVDHEKIAIVNSPDEAIPVFAAHYKRYPPKWVRINDALYTKDTHFGGPDVKRDEQGAWIAYRGADCPLLRDGMPATFATRQEAQHLADLHEDEGYGNSVPIDDGYSWQVDPNVDEWLAVRGRTRTSDTAAVAA